METYQYRRLSSSDANSTVTVCTGPVSLHSITINTTSAHALTVTDGATNGTSTTVATIKASIAEQTLTFNVDCAYGLKVTVPTGYTGDATIAFKPL